MNNCYFNIIFRGKKYCIYIFLIYIYLMVIFIFLKLSDFFKKIVMILNVVKKIKIKSK